jgi:hypothetical protein
MDDLDVLIGGKAMAENGYQTLVELDGENTPGAPSEAASEGSQPCANLHDHVCWVQGSGVDDAAQDTLADQEVLTQPLAWPDVELLEELSHGRGSELVVFQYGYLSLG